MGALYANQSVSDKSWVNRCQATTKAISFWTQGSVADICGVLVTLVIRCVPDKVWTACTFLGVVHGLLLARQTHRDARESGWGPLHSAYIPNQGNSFHSQSLSLFWALLPGRTIYTWGRRVVAIGNWIANCKFWIFNFPNFGFPNPNPIFTWGGRVVAIGEAADKERRLSSRWTFWQTILFWLPRFVAKYPFWTKRRKE